MAKINIQIFYPKNARISTCKISACRIVLLSADFLSVNREDVMNAFMKVVDSTRYTELNPVTFIKTAKFVMTSI